METMKNSIIRPAYLPPLVAYRIAVAVLLSALLMVSMAYRRQVQEMYEAQSRADRAESRLRSLEKSVVLPADIPSDVTIGDLRQFARESSVPDRSFGWGWMREGNGGTIIAPEPTKHEPTANGSK